MSDDRLYQTFLTLVSVKFSVVVSSCLFEPCFYVYRIYNATRVSIVFSYRGSAWVSSMFDRVSAGVFEMCFYSAFYACVSIMIIVLLSGFLMTPPSGVFAAY